jgi:hypothetical protein
MLSGLAPPLPPPAVVSVPANSVVASAPPPLLPPAPAADAVPVPDRYKHPSALSQRQRSRYHSSQYSCQAAPQWPCCRCNRLLYPCRFAVLRCLIGCRYMSGCTAVAALLCSRAAVATGCYTNAFVMCCGASLVVADERRPPPQCSRYHLHRAPVRRLTGSAAAAIWCVCTRACHFLEHPRNDASCAHSHAPSSQESQGSPVPRCSSCRCSPTASHCCGRF